ncbi:NAD(P)H-dependent flavin oxidoreductase [Sphingomonas pruni]|uniref:NAD(P)H-dependent flavin oxidoreductase n=1 Tax=Sphingomonas pruni TaxID=40683 RepID=UPI00083551E8|nr:nitronate monooxygenase [Sphingomonas pruni]
MSAATDRFLALTGARLPLVQAPMANFAGSALAIAALKAGAVGSLACAVLSPDQVAAEVAAIRAAAAGPINVNFFCHKLGPQPDESAWHAALAPFYQAEGVTPPAQPPALRKPFDAAMADAIEAVRPEIVSFHFGLPERDLLDRVRATGARIFGNATTLAEAHFLADAGVDAIIAQGFEAGGHAGHFLIGHRPIGVLALVRQILNHIDLPVIAAGGIADAGAAKGAVAAGAAAVQVGTAYLRTPEATTSAVHRRLLAEAKPEDSVFTNLFSGGLARGLRNRLIEALGPVSDVAPPFPYASAALAQLRAKAEADGRGDYSPLWAGQGVGLSDDEPAEDLTARLGAAALEGSRI